MQLDIMKEYPLLSSWNKSTYWNGFISIEGSLIHLSLKTPNFPSIRGTTLKWDEETRRMHSSVRNQILDLIESDCNVLKFLESLVNLLKTSEASDGSESINPQFYTTLLTELDQIGIENVSFVSKNYREISIKHFDPSGRAHVIKCFLSSQYPRVPLDIIAELPGLPDGFRWPSKMMEANNHFHTQLQIFDVFWNEMEILDKQAKVIDPQNPNPSHCHRRILLEDRVIIHIIMDPFKPKTFPEIHISGPHKIVSELDTLVEKQCKNWNPDFNILENLEAILQVNCRVLETDDGVCCDLELICAVCYLYSYEGEIPDKNCDCGANYHNKCLLDLYSNDFLTNVKACVECPGCGTDIIFQAK